MAAVKYSIREVDGNDDDVAETLRELHAITFFRSAPPIKPEIGHWWLAYHGNDPIAFIGVCRSTHVRGMGYFSRVGVLKAHRGNRLQGRLMRAMESRAKRNGWLGIISDTTANPPSANSFIRAGYRTFTPKVPWSFPSSIYWRKDF